ncbi:unnamed protein product [Calypogeia fissa]
MVTESNDLPSPSPCPSQTSGSLNASEEVRLRVTLLYSKVTGEVLCLETGKDFVDLLLGFLTLPLGCILKLLMEGSLVEPQELSSVEEKLGFIRVAQSGGFGHSKDGRLHHLREKREEVAPLTSIANLCESVAKMEDTYFCVDKALLLDPRPIAVFGGKLLPVSPLTVKKDKTTEYFCCGIACNFLCPKQGAKCPRHKRKMDTPCKTVDEEELGGQTNAYTGYAREGQFIITNTLDIYPSSAIKSLMHLSMLKSERVSDLDNIEILVGAEEVLLLMKVSLCSGNVLNKVFGKHCPRPPPPPFYNYRPHDTSRCRICPASAKGL